MDGTRNESFPRSGGVGQPREIHGFPGHRIVRVAADAARDDLPARHADMHLQRALHLAADGRHDRLDSQRRAYSALRVVRVSNGRTEHGHNAVANVLVDGTAVSFDDIVYRREVAV